MNYIRTKDGIYEVLRESETKKSYITKKNGLVIHKDKVIAQADTIEELCDRFICWTTRDESVFMDMVQVGFNSKYFKYKSIYGAIWTEWGLKYVTRMNEEGKFELL